MNHQKLYAKLCVCYFWKKHEKLSWNSQGDIEAKKAKLLCFARCYAIMALFQSLG